MEQVAGSNWEKGNFLAKQLIGPARVLSTNYQKKAVLQNIFSHLLSKCYHSCFIYIVSFELELISYMVY
jgi:hypothetical protein